MATSMDVLKKDGGRSESSCFCPIPSAAVGTAAIASKNSTAPLPPVPWLINFPRQTSSQLFELSQAHLEKQQQSIPTQQTTVKTKTQQTSDTRNTDNSRDMVFRSGKWTAEEELYANSLIELFEEGCVDEFEQSMDCNGNNASKEDEKKPPKFKITNGMSLRAYLSRKLFCSPMRISKKFAGRGIGKLVYMSQRQGSFQGVQQSYPRCSR